MLKEQEEGQGLAHRGEEMTVRGAGAAGKDQGRGPSKQHPARSVYPKSKVNHSMVLKQR